MQADFGIHTDKWTLHALDECLPRDPGWSLPADITQSLIRRGRPKRVTPTLMVSLSTEASIRAAHRLPAIPLLSCPDCRSTVSSPPQSTQCLPLQLRRLLPASWAASGSDTPPGCSPEDYTISGRRFDPVTRDEICLHLSIDQIIHTVESWSRARGLSS
jgi:hypothetical protein